MIRVPHFDRKHGQERFVDDLCTWICAQRRHFTHHGTVVTGWRNYRGHRLGPYYRLMFRVDKQQKSVYLGSSEAAARQVAELLRELQQPLRVHRSIGKLRMDVRRSLREHKKLWQRDLARLGLYVKGLEIRGWRKRARMAEGLTAEERSKEQGVRS